MTFAEQYADAIKGRRVKLRKRGFVLAAETAPPAGQAALWYADAVQCVPRSGQAVARQIARLCGDESEVTVPWRSLADAVGWLEVETVGNKRGAKTTFRLLASDRSSECLGWTGDLEWFTEAA
ncbi:hypothetical protein ABZT17_31055 [Streptomyces sp. NPDC005648]|uniref:hypothetical protein n=1 Tax=Streptomyces sp. NPDC005648 TaxID=3157044 RepID=UPI0033A8716B